MIRYTSKHYSPTHDRLPSVWVRRKCPPISNVQSNVTAHRQQSSSAYLLNEHAHSISTARCLQGTQLLCGELPWWVTGELPWHGISTKAPPPATPLAHLLPLHA